MRVFVYIASNNKTIGVSVCVCVEAMPQRMHAPSNNCGCINVKGWKSVIIHAFIRAYRPCAAYIAFADGGRSSSMLSLATTSLWSLLLLLSCRPSAWKMLLLNSAWGGMEKHNVVVDNLYSFATAEWRWMKRLTFVISLMKHNQSKNVDFALIYPFYCVRSTL